MRLCLYTYAVTLEINSLQNAGSPTGDSKGLCCSYFFRGIPLIVKFCYSVATNLSPKDAKWLSLESQSCGNFFFRNSSYGIFAAKSILLVKVRVNRDQCVGWTDCRGRVAVLPGSLWHHLLSAAPPQSHTLSEGECGTTPRPWARPPLDPEDRAFCQHPENPRRFP